MIWEITNEPANRSGTVAWEQAVADYVRSYQSSKGYLTQLVGITGCYPEGNQDSYNTAINATNADWSAPAANYGGSAFQSGNPAAASGDRVRIIDADHVFGEGGDMSWVWKMFARGYGGVWYMDDLAGSGLPGYPSSSSVLGTEVSARAGMKAFASVLPSIDLTTMTPQNSLSTTTYCLADTTNGQFVVLAPSGGAFTVNLSSMSGKTLAATWININGGATSAGGNVPGGNAAQSFTAPTNPAALLLLAGAP